MCCDWPQGEPIGSGLAWLPCTGRDTPVRKLPHVIFHSVAQSLRACGNSKGVLGPFSRDSKKELEHRHSLCLLRMVEKFCHRSQLGFLSVCCVYQGTPIKKQDPWGKSNTSHNGSQGKGVLDESYRQQNRCSPHVFLRWLLAFPTLIIAYVKGWF